jgi:hypothetical protein
MQRAFEQSFDLCWRHVDELLADREHLPHPDPEEDVASSVFAVTGLEVALDLPKLIVGLVRPQRLDEPLGAHVC